MPVWETPQLLSGDGQQQTIPLGDKKPELGLCVIHTGTVSMEWAVRFRHIQIPPYVWSMNTNQPYDTAREMCTRVVLERNPKWIFHLDSDLLIQINAIPVMIEWAERFNIPLLSGLYWAKKPSGGQYPPPMPAAWIKTGWIEAENKNTFSPLDIKPHMNKQSLVKCDVTGAGCLLIKADIFKKLDESDPKKPYFQWGLMRRDKEGKPLLQCSEDFYFCMRCCEELDIHPHVATAIRCEHICKAVRRPDDGEFELLLLKG